jgi:hypothetical protein
MDLMIFADFNIQIRRRATKMGSQTTEVAHYLGPIDDWNVIDRPNMTVRFLAVRPIRMDFWPAYFVRRKGVWKFTVQFLVRVHITLRHSGLLVFLRHIDKGCVASTEFGTNDHLNEGTLLEFLGGFRGPRPTSAVGSKTRYRNPFQIRLRK